MCLLTWQVCQSWQLLCVACVTWQVCQSVPATSGDGPIRSFWHCHDKSGFRHVVLDMLPKLFSSSERTAVMCVVCNMTASHDSCYVCTDMTSMPVMTVVICVVCDMTGMPVSACDVWGWTHQRFLTLSWQKQNLWQRNGTVLLRSTRCGLAWLHWWKLRYFWTACCFSTNTVSVCLGLCECCQS